MRYMVYGLVDPRTYQVFYVGMSKDPRQRLRHHQNDPSSAAYQRCQEIRAAGESVGIDILGASNDRIAVKREERRLILTRDGLVNSKNPKGLLSQLLYPD